MGNKLENLGEQQHFFAILVCPCASYESNRSNVSQDVTGESTDLVSQVSGYGICQSWRFPMGVPPNHPCFGFSMINIDKPTILGYPHDLGKTISLKCIRNQPLIHHVIFPHPQSPRRSSSSAPLRPSRLAWLQPSHPTASLWLRVIHGKPWFIHMLFFNKEI